MLFHYAAVVNLAAYAAVANVFHDSAVLVGISGPEF
jgi:hypothetical protein